MCLDFSSANDNLRIEIQFDSPSEFLQSPHAVVFSITLYRWLAGCAMIFAVSCVCACFLTQTLLFCWRMTLTVRSSYAI